MSEKFIKARDSYKSWEINLLALNYIFHHNNINTYTVYTRNTYLAFTVSDDVEYVIKYFQTYVAFTKRFESWRSRGYYIVHELW